LRTSSDHDLILASPVARALVEIGDRWTALILRDAFLGVRHFEEFLKRSGATRGTLSSRLKGMVENDILYKKPYQDSPTRYEYRLTDKGRDLYPFMLAVWAWETRWSKERHIPPALTHSLCGKRMRPVFRCGDCHTPILPREVVFEAGPGQQSGEKVPARLQRRSRSSRESGHDVDRRFFHVLDIIGDRWTGMVVAALYFGLNRFDEIGSALGIATNILADRLKLLVSVKVISKIPYQKKPVRYEYRFTEKGSALYTNVLQMHEWAGRWLSGSDQPTLILTHLPCGSLLHSELVCSECQQGLKMQEVEFKRDFYLDR
jgi:DNA-binding HxlR family transcriptional regulator